MIEIDRLEVQASTFEAKEVLIVHDFSTRPLAGQETEAELCGDRPKPLKLGLVPKPIFGSKSRFVLCEHKQEPKVNAPDFQININFNSKFSAPPKDACGDLTCSVSPKLS